MPLTELEIYKLAEVMEEYFESYWIMQPSNDGGFVKVTIKWKQFLDDIIKPKIKMKKPVQSK